MFDVVLKLFQISSSTIGIEHYRLSQKLFQFMAIFFQTIFNTSHLEHLLSVLRTRAIIARFRFLGVEGRGEATTRVTSIVGANLMKLHRVVKSARETACCYCHKIECLHAKWQEHVSRHFQCFVESWAEKANSFGETGYNNYSYCDGKEIRNHFLQLYVSIYYTSNLAML